jgi:hypothetical protein
LGIASVSPSVQAQSAADASKAPLTPLAGYVTEVSGSSVRLSLTEGDGIQVGDEFSALQYGEEIARLRIRIVTKRESIADLLVQKQGVLLRRLDTVIPSTAVSHPAADLQPVPSPSPKQVLRPGKSKRRSRSQPNDGEIVSRADWVYPALSTLAERKLLSTQTRQFHGDQELTRGEVRGLIEKALEHNTSGSGPQSPPDAQKSSPENRKSELGTNRLLFHLAQDYDLESDIQEPKRGFALSHYSRYRVASGEEPTLVTSGTVQGFAHLGRDDYAVLSLSRARREWYGDNGYRWLNEAYVKTKWLGVDWNIGQKTMRWGPGYSGSLILDDVAAPLPMIRGQRGWSLGRLGYWKMDQFGSRFKEDGKSKYFMGRRVSHSLGQKWSLGISETAKSDTAPNPSALLLPFLVYQRLFEKNTNVINVQAGTDLHYQNGNTSAYTEFFIDDITAPKGLRSQGKVPRKIGYLVGWRRARLFGEEGTDLRVEYARTDRNTYLHRNPSISYFERGLPLGHPMGPNAQSILVRADRRISPKLEMTGAVQFLSRSNSAPPDSASGTAFTLAAAYDLRNDRSLTLKVSPSRRVDRYTSQSGGTVEFIADWVF